MSDDRNTNRDRITRQLERDVRTIADTLDPVGLLTDEPRHASTADRQHAEAIKRMREVGR